MGVPTAPFAIHRGVYGMVFRYAWIKGAILFIASRSVLTMPPLDHS